MNGYVKLTPEWVCLDGIKVTDIAGNDRILVMLTGDEYYLQVDGTYAKGDVGVYFWFGSQPPVNSHRGAELLSMGQQGRLVKGADTIWVRSVSIEADLIIRKVR